MTSASAIRRDLLDDLDVPNAPERIEKLQTLMIVDKTSVFEACWSDLETRVDKYDGMLVTELMVLCAKIDANEMWKRLLNQWKDFSGEQRQHFVENAARNDVFSLERWLTLFSHTDTSKYNRQFLFGALVSGAYATRYGEFVNQCISVLERENVDDEEYVRWLRQLITRLKATP